MSDKKIYSITITNIVSHYDSSNGDTYKTKNVHSISETSLDKLYNTIRDIYKIYENVKTIPEEGVVFEHSQIRVLSNENFINFDYNFLS